MNTTTTYKFSDLPTQALKDAAIEANRDINTSHHDWHECTLDDWKEKLGALGYDSPEIAYSGFWSQGDGASFTASSVPSHTTDPKVIEAWELVQRMHELAGPPTDDNGLEDITRWSLEDMANGKVYRHCHRYSHENTVSVDWDSDDFPCTSGLLLEEHWNTLWQAIEDYYEGLDDTVRDLCREIYSDLEDEYEYLTSDEVVAETLDSNDYEFEVDEEGGELVL